MCIRYIAEDIPGCRYTVDAASGVNFSGCSLIVFVLLIADLESEAVTIEMAIY